MKRASFYDPLRPQTQIDSIRPYYEDRVLVRRLPWPENFDSKLIAAPADRKDGDQLGEVVAVGPGISRRVKEELTAHGTVYETIRKSFERIPCQVKPGDRVIYQRWPSLEFLDGGETYTFLYEEQSILGVLD